MTEIVRSVPPQLAQQENGNKMRHRCDNACEGVANADPENHSLSGGGEVKKSNNRRKKKNRLKDLPSSKVEGDCDAAFQHNTERGKGKDIEGVGGENDGQVSNPNALNDEGWEVAGARKFRRNDVVQQSQYGQAHQAAGSAREVPSVIKSGSSLGPSGAQKGDGVRPRQWRTSERTDGLGGSQNKELNRNRSLEAQQNAWKRNPVIGRGHSVIEVVPGGNSSNVPDPWNGQGILPPPAGVWHQRSTNDAAMPILGNNPWGNRSSGPEMSQMEFKLPSEMQEGMNGVGLAGSEKSIICAPSHGGMPEICDDPPSSPHSHSICSEGDLDDESDCVASEDFDSDASEVTHEIRKKDKRIRQFFETMAALTMDQLNEHDRQWHCPACQGGVGAIDWYRGLQPLLAHANSIRSKRVKLHRHFAKVLDEELKIRGASSGQIDGMFGKWKGLREDNESVNPMIVWPPAIIIQNTRLELDEQEKWIGMGNKELLDHFKEYNVAKARHAYGPQGHRGMSVLVFSDSPTGYMDAQRLNKHFKEARRGKENWEQPGRILFYPGGKRMLYGYLATAEDMEIFNRHSGKSKLKWTQRRLQEAVVEPIRQMDADNQQLNWLKQKVEQQKEHSKTLEQTVCFVTRKLRLRDEEIQVIRKRALEQHEEHQREMDELECAYKTKLNQLTISRAKQEEELQKKEDDFKQEQLRLVQQLEKTLDKIPNDKNIGDNQLHLQQAKVEEEIARKSELIEMSLEDSADYEFQKREIMRKHHLKRVEFMRQQYEQMLHFEEEIEKQRLGLQEQYLQQREESELINDFNKGVKMGKI